MIATVAALQLLSTPLLYAQGVGSGELPPPETVSAEVDASSTEASEAASSEMPALIMPSGEMELSPAPLGATEELSDEPAEETNSPRVSNRPVKLDEQPDALEAPAIPHGGIPHGDVLPSRSNADRIDGARALRGPMPGDELPPFAFDEKTSSPIQRISPPTAAPGPGIPATQAQQGLAAAMPIVSVETSGPHESYVGRAETYSIVVNNLGDTIARDVQVDVMLPRTASRVETSPKCSPVAPFHIRFDVGAVGVKQKKTLKVRLTPTARGGAEIRTRVALSASSALSVKTMEAKLEITAAGPAKLGFGQQANFKITVKNTGDAAAEDVKISSLIPDGVEVKTDAEGGQLGYIAAGESRDLYLQVIPKLSGQISLKFTATNKYGEKSQITRPVEVVRPMVEVVTQGPALNYLKRDGIYSVSITNPGDAAATKVKVQTAIPAGIHVTAIDRVAKYDKVSRTLTWTLPNLASGAHEVFRFRATAVNEGRHVHDVLVTAAGGLRSTSRHITEVISRADVSMQIADTAGPVQVGSPAIFEVLVRNRGTKEAGNVAVSVKLPASLKPVRSVAYTSAGQSIRFPVVSLEPGAQKVLRFEAVSDEAGDHIVQVSLRSDSLQRELSAEESIFFYESQKKPGNIATRPGSRVIDY